MTNTTQTLVVESHIRVTARVTPEALPFFHDHGCTIQRQQYSDTVIFPAGSRQEKLSSTSQVCSRITLPDGTIITAINCYTKYILLVIDPMHGHSRQLAL